LANYFDDLNYRRLFLFAFVYILYFVPVVLISKLMLIKCEKDNLKNLLNKIEIKLIINTKLQ
jgi:hypothetical protein